MIRDLSLAVGLMGVLAAGTISASNIASPGTCGPSSMRQYRKAVEAYARSELGKAYCGLVAIQEAEPGCSPVKRALSRVRDDLLQGAGELPLECGKKAVLGERIEETSMPSQCIRADYECAVDLYARRKVEESYRLLLKLSGERPNDRVVRRALRRVREELKEDRKGRPGASSLTPAVSAQSMQRGP